VGWTIKSHLAVGWADENRYDSLFVLTKPNSGKAPGLLSEKKKKRKLTQRRSDAKKRKEEQMQ